MTTVEASIIALKLLLLILFRSEEMHAFKHGTFYRCNTPCYNEPNFFHCTVRLPMQLKHEAH